MTAQHTLISSDPVRLDLSSVRLLRVPEVAPPFDGESVPAGAAPPARVPVTAASAPATGVPVTAAGDPAAGDPVTGEARCAPVAAEPAVDCGWARQFARLLVESLAGVRPLRQLLPWLSGNAPVHLRRIAPVFGGGQRPQVLRVLASWPADSVAEITIIVRLGPRTRALAARLVDGSQPGQPTRWLCTDIEAA